MKFKPYQKYKDSGIKWIGKIPEKWKIIQVRGVCKLGRGRVISNQEIEENQGEYPVFSSQTSNNGEMGKVDTYDFNGEYVTWTTDGANAGTTFYRNEKFNCTNVCGTLKRKNNKIHMKLLPYILNGISKYYVRYDINPKLMNDMMARIKIPLTMLNHQIIIAKFLDKKTENIEKLIEKDKKLIEFLKEKRIALINHAVTKGLDLNAKMKDSGIEWIGDIPENWEVRRLKFLTSKINSGITPRSGAEVYTEVGIPLLRSQNIHFKGVNFKDVVYIPEEIHRAMMNSVVNKHDVLINITGASIGRCAYIDDEFEKANVNQHVCIIRSNKIDYRYLTYFLSSDHGQDQVFSIQMGSSREGLNFEQLGNFVVPIIPVSVQIEIVLYLDIEIKKIDKTIDKIEEKIKLLEEYKKSLIHHVVTGKIDVREVV